MLNNTLRKKKINFNRNRRRLKLIENGTLSNKNKKNQDRLQRKRNCRLKYFESRSKCYRRLCKVGKATNRYGDLLKSKKISKNIALN